jgi:uncharacterized LabA/DUF88 family protein
VTATVGEPLRVFVFVDAQNVYRDARRAFFSEGDPSSFGQIHVGKYGLHLTKLVEGHVQQPCALAQVRIYSGQPDPIREPVAASSTERQVTAWEVQGAIVSRRPLRYPSDWPATKAQQKGVDVQMSLDLAQFYQRDLYDIGIVATTDTDMRPAVESVLDIAGPDCKYPPVFTCAWNSPVLNRRLWLMGRPLFCFYLRRADYDAVADLTRYGPPKT